MSPSRAEEFSKKEIVVYPHTPKKPTKRGTGFSDMDAGHLTLFGFQMT